MATRRMLAIVNPRGGRRRGLAVLDRVRPVFRDAAVELDVRLTEHVGHAGKIARDADLDGLAGLCVVGGDGTIHEVVDGLLRRGDPVSVPLGVIPAGSGNTLHKHLGCADPLEAARRIVAGQTLPLDVARVSMGSDVAYCVNIVGWGSIAEINGTAEKLRALGPTRYAWAALWHIARPRRRRARLVLDGETFDDDFLFVIACNGKYTGKGMALAPHAQMDDGKIDVLVLRRASRWQMVRLLARVFNGTHLALGCLEYRQVRSLAIESDDKNPLDLDGEIKGTAPVRVEMLPGAIRVFA
ncbi:MAG: diacylglycerol kinase family lipid kinase [Pirellulales bacterium]|nr:diacylglycerol kinase family lipid kinase [Pirellulales bacterium]